MGDKITDIGFANTTYIFAERTYMDIIILYLIAVIYCYGYVIYYKLGICYWISEKRKEIPCADKEKRS